MGNLDIWLLTVHLFCATLFIGTVFFWTFIIDVVRNNNPQLDLDEAETLFSRRIRPIMSVNVTILLFTGLALFYNRHAALKGFDTLYAYALSFKGLLGIAGILAFYFMPQIMKLFKNKMHAHDIAHYVLFGIMIAIVILAKMLYL
ncbi:MAG: hypothetical protein ACTTJS_01420 [Wolinella sp.]